MRYRDQIGLGLVGLATALSLNILYPTKKVVLKEKVDLATEIQRRTIEGFTKLSVVYVHKVVSLCGKYSLNLEEFPELLVQPPCDNLINRDLEMGKDYIRVSIRSLPQEREYIQCLNQHYVSLIEKRIKDSNKKKELGLLLGELEEWIKKR